MVRNHQVSKQKPLSQDRGFFLILEKATCVAFVWFRSEAALQGCEPAGGPETYLSLKTKASAQKTGAFF